MTTLAEAKRVRAAIHDFKELIRERFPQAEFNLVKGFDPPGTYLEVRVDSDDYEQTFEQVFDAIQDRLVDYQVDGPLPLMVLPLRPQEAFTTN
jgi:hypothetical protein